MSTVKDNIYECLGNAFCEGWPEIVNETPEFLASDLKDKTDQFDDVEEVEMIPHIKAWLEARKA